MTIERWQFGVQVFSIACLGVLIWRVLSERLAKIYPFLAAFVGAELLQDLLLFPIDFNSTLYGLFYLLTTPIIWVLAYFVVLELYRLTFEDYPGISSAGRKAVSWSMGLALLVSLLYAIPDLRTNKGPFPILRIYYVLERSMVLALLLFLVLIQLFLVRYRLRLPPNRMVYAVGYAIYFGITVAQDVIFTALGVHVIFAVGIWTNIAGGLVLLTGAALLSRKGETRVQLEGGDSSAERLRLQQQLSDMNRLLSRAARGGN